MSNIDGWTSRVSTKVNIEGNVFLLRALVEYSRYKKYDIEEECTHTNEYVIEANILEEKELYIHNTQIYEWETLFKKKHVDTINKAIDEAIAEGKS
jgi:hypothetical protein